MVKIDWDIIVPDSDDDVITEEEYMQIMSYGVYSMEKLDDDIKSIDGYFGGKL